MISIPIWLFVIFIIYTAIISLSLLMLIIFIFIALREPVEEYPNYCPEDVDPDYNPEYIPKEERK